MSQPHKHQARLLVQFPTAAAQASRQEGPWRVEFSISETDARWLTVRWPPSNPAGTERYLHNDITRVIMDRDPVLNVHSSQL